jgi:predicted nucleotidyltransferase component of viral defense system
MDKNMLLEIGKKKGLKNREHIEKDYFQDLFLFNLFSRTSNVVFKGGTALYKIYKIPRFSEDLDFNLLTSFDAEIIVRDAAKHIDAKVIARKTSDSLLFKISFTGLLTKYNTLRIDISTKSKVLDGFDVKNYVPEYIDISPFSLRVLKPEEMCAEKIHSIMARKKARDLYDLFFLLRLAKFNKSLVDKKLAIFGMKFSYRKFKKAVEESESLWEHELRPFVLESFVDFDTAKKFILGRIGNSS